jgi:Zn finger protein HypA/HybF involved in hydrogenase expression
MGHNIDFATAFSIINTKCPHCQGDMDYIFEELDIDCGVNKQETNLLEIDVACIECDKEMRISMELDLKIWKL